MEPNRIKFRDKVRFKSEGVVQVRFGAGSGGNRFRIWFRDRWCRYRIKFRRS